MHIKVKKIHPDAKMPERANPTDAGWDIFATSKPLWSNGFIEYETGLILEPEPGWSIELRPRSSLSKYDLLLCNPPGTLDNAYRGEVKARFKFIPKIVTDTNGNYAVANKMPIVYQKGDKIAQLVVHKDEIANFVEAKELSETARGSGGFGSSDRKQTKDSYELAK